MYAEQADLLGEGPLWSAAEQALYWLDIGQKILYRKTPSDEHRQYRRLPDYPGCLAELAPGVIAIAMGEGVKRLTLDSGAIDLLYARPSRCPAPASTTARWTREAASGWALCKTILPRMGRQWLSRAPKVSSIDLSPMGL